MLRSHRPNHWGMSLRDDLKLVDGIGDAKADELMEIIETHQNEFGGMSDLEAKARECAAVGKDARAGMFLRRDMNDE